MQFDQLPTESHVELEDGSITGSIFLFHLQVDVLNCWIWLVTDFLYITESKFKAWRWPPEPEVAIKPVHDLAQSSGCSRQAIRQPTSACDRIAFKFLFE